MAKDYNKLCPNLSKHITKEKVDEDLVLKVKVIDKEPSLTKEKVEDAYEMLKVDPQYVKIAAQVGLLAGQVKELHQEMMAYKNWTEPIIEE